MTAKDNDRARERDGVRLRVPIDASHLEELREEKSQDLQVVVRLADGQLYAETIDLDDGAGAAEFAFDEPPDAVEAFVGPERADPEELVQSQTITVTVPGDRWIETPRVELEPIRIPPYYWDWWYRWCREFVVRGRLTCPDGSPVPGAEVCAKDVDSWLYWSSTEEVGCDTTDQHGAFEIRFRWCCGFWPWWWWQRRAWRPEPELVERVRSAVEDQPDLSLARAETQPSLDPVADLLEDDPLPIDEPLPELDPDQLERVRTDLIDRLPDIPELRRRRVWPWAPWQPWWDCTPDLIFEATQDGDVVLEEGIGDARWDVSTEESVVLTADEDAVCVPPECENPPCPGDECLLVTAACGADIDRVGGNLGAPATPEGYLAPGSPPAGSARHDGDRPFAETVTLWRSAPPLQGVDYLEFEYDDGSGWDAVPHDAVENFERAYVYYDPTAPSGSQWEVRRASFDFSTIDGHWVVQTRERYEETTPPTWPGEPGTTNAWWGRDRDLLVPIDSTAFPDGTYRFRVVGWEATAGGELTDRRVIPRCGDGDQADQPVEVVLTFDNRLEPDPAHPTSPDHPCGSGTVHRCVTEPDTDVIDVRVGGTSLEPCDVVPKEDGTLEVDFLAHDPDGHLSHYTLRATYAENQVVDLLDQPSTSIDPLPPGSSPPPYPGPEYGQALGQGASRPHWEGGRYRLTVDLDEAFPEPCCYQLELRAWKRTLVDCRSTRAHRNRSEYTIGIGI
jgi:hypothetical protein